MGRIMDFEWEEHIDGGDCLFVRTPANHLHPYHDAGIIEMVNGAYHFTPSGHYVTLSADDLEEILAKIREVNGQFIEEGEQGNSSLCKDRTVLCDGCTGLENCHLLKPQHVTGA